jgi:hypothetical protein
MLEIIDYIDSACEELVNLFTVGQISAIKDMYEDWLSTAPHYDPNVLGYAFAVFIVAVRFIVPVVLFYYIFVRNIFKDIRVRILLVSIFATAFALFWFNPIQVFEEAAQGVTNFYYFLMDLPSIETEPLVFIFLTNGLAVFVIRAIVSFAGICIMIGIFTYLVTFIVWLITAGKTPWSYTDKSMKALVVQLAIAFMIFYPLLGAFRTFATLITLAITAIDVKEIYYTMRGYQKICYSVGDKVECRWAK